MTKYKVYPEYKDSGLSWCDTLPLRWKTSRLRWLSYIYAGGTPSKNVTEYWDNGTIPWINSGSVNQGYIIEPSEYISKGAYKNSSAKWIPKGSLVLALAGQGKTKGMVAQLGIDTTCNQSMAAIVFYEKSQSRYIYWWLVSNYQNIRNMSGGDLRDGLNLEVLGGIACPQPSMDESHKIASFLDHETAKIDKLIEKQKQLIELLNEKRQAVISHAVTKGLNPNVPMKDSKNTLLGKIPAHWGLTPMSFLADSITVGIVVTPAKYYKDSGVKCFRSLNVGENTIREQDWVYISEVSNNLLCKSKVYTGDILVVRSGQPGTATVVRDEFCGCNCIDLIIIRRSKRFDSNFICMQINSPFVKKQVGMASDGAIQLHFNVEVAKKLVLTEPPKEEQSEIFNFLSQKNKYFDELMKKSELQINLLQERRTALISAAVTGKIDVRDWVAPDMQDAEEPQETTV
ncbi:restriction endonuclease subunit S [Serratia nevei]|uniref:restriction endonuclease subunit S n=1 Tax=Serratia nevei TaxID=2703794 RepID=UPI003FA77C23